jgi:hypothetical protein
MGKSSRKTVAKGASVHFANPQTILTGPVSERPEGEPLRALLAEGRKLDVESGGRTLRIEGRDGEVELTVEITETGPRLTFTGADLRLEGTKRLELTGEEVEVRSEKAVSVEGHAVSVRSRRGNVSVDANDDVRINGERIFLNS